MDETTWKDHYKYEYPKFWANRVKEYGFLRYHQMILDLLDPKKGESVLECGIGTGEPFALRLAKGGVDMFPLLHDKVNLCRRSDLFSYGLQDSALRYFGAKLVYICKKDSDKR